MRFTQAGGYEGELEHWLGEGAQAVEIHHQDSGQNREEERACVRVELDEEKTRQLLQEVPGVYHTQINDVLLAAVAGAWARRSKAQPLLIDVEGHGRDGAGPELDVSRTVGWFTAVYPVRLFAEREHAPEERLKRIKEQLRKVPGQGVGYGALRYIKDANAGGLAWRAGAEISFNYLGQMDAALPEQGLFRTVKALEENSRGAKPARPLA